VIAAFRTLCDTTEPIWEAPNILKTTRDLPLVLGGEEDIQVTTYTDASLGTAPKGRSVVANTTRRATTCVEDSPTPADKLTKLGTREDHEAFTYDIMGHCLLK